MLPSNHLDIILGQRHDLNDLPWRRKLPVIEKQLLEVVVGCCVSGNNKIGRFGELWIDVAEPAIG